MTPAAFAKAVNAHGTINKAADACGVPRSTAKRLYARAGGKAKAGKAAPPVPLMTFPEIADRKEPLPELLSRRMKHFERLRAHDESATWHTIKINSRKPIGLAFLGDPHLDDDGCNWPLLMRHVALLRDQPGMFAVNIGDTTNNWVGGIARLFGKQETSQTSARQLAEWFLTGAGIHWAAILLGNHDAWNEGGEIIRRMVAGAKIESPVSDWAAKFELEFPNGSKVHVNAAHDFKGRSIYSTTHGPLREAIWAQNDDADIYACGHIHYYGLQQIELPGGRVPWLTRVRGYKEFDEYARVNGFHESKFGAASLAIIDPNAPRGTRVTMFGDMVQGARVLAAMRGDDVSKIYAQSKAITTKKKRKAKR